MLPICIEIETLLHSHLILQMQTSPTHPNTNLYEVPYIQIGSIQIIIGIDGTARWHKVGRVLRFGIIDIQRISMFHSPSLLCKNVYYFSEMCLPP